ncbi:MAG: membrane protein insertase YidC [Gammaproteobacteria bacterium]|nr:membrane protein insertase YidC [Gammaproteobacteria bacterium]
MDNFRLALFLALAVILGLLWQAWQQEHPSAPPVATSTATSVSDATIPSAPTTAAAPAAAAPKVEELLHGQRIEVVTDMVRAEIDTHGGDLRQLLLLKHPVSVDKPHEPFALLQETPSQEMFIAQSGLIGRSEDYPTHKTSFTAEATNYTLAADQNELRVPLSWRGADGVQYSKGYVFHRGSYVVDVEFVVHNTTKKEWAGFFYGQFERAHVDQRGMFSLPIYVGGAIYTPENKYQKIPFADMASKPLKRESIDGWVAMLQHYFVGAWIAGPTDRNELYSAVLPNQNHAIGLKNLTPTQVAPGQTGKLHARLYVGPKAQDQLKDVAPGLQLTVDYGWLTIISAPLFWLLKWIHHWIGNWGWSIILLTITIKLAFYPLSATSYKSMAQMKKLQPKMQSLKERHGDDRQKYSQAMMELYKTEKINPLGGCLPIVIQIPVFLALYWVLLESVEMRHAPFVLWVRDLSSPDPYFVLPILMGITMYAQQLLNPQPPDAMQRRVFMIMPIAFTAMFLFFPAGLVLYWAVNNLLSILQQWRINSVIGAKNS